MPDPLSTLTENCIVQARMFIRPVDSVAPVSMNVFNYRVNSGEQPWTQGVAEQVHQQFAANVIENWSENLPDTYEIFRVDYQLFKSVTPPSIVWTFSDGSGFTPVEGLLAEGIAEDAIAFFAACLLMKSFRTGRISLGRKFFGPLLGRFQSDGTIVPDPTGDGDLRDVRSSVFAQLDPVVEGSPSNLRPCVMGFHDSGDFIEPVRVPSPLDDVREVTFSPYVTSLRSRRPTTGM